MFLNLLIKEFKNGALTEKVKKSNFFSLLLNLILAASFVVLEIVLFRLLDRKLSVFPGAGEAFLIIFLFSVGAIHILYLTSVVRKTLFSSIDSAILITRPVNPVLSILSKIVFVYIRNVAENYLIAFPILFSFGTARAMNSRALFLIFLYPVFIAVFETGASFLLSLPYQGIHRFLKRHPLIKTGGSFLISIGLCFLYSEVLNAFLTLVRDNNIYAIFSERSILRMNEISVYLIPTRFFVEMLDFEAAGFLSLAMISAAVFVLGTLIGSKFYLISLKKESGVQRVRRVGNCALVSPTRALLRKELALYFENSGSVFSHGNLVVMEPFLTVLVIEAMNMIFRTGILTYVSGSFPYFLPLIQMLFIALFSTFVNTTASFVISREGMQGVRILKTIPVSYKKQIRIKMLIPFMLSLISLTVSVSVLAIRRQMSLGNACLAFLFSTVLIVLLELISVEGDLKFASGENSNISALISLLSIVIPTAEVVLMFLLSLSGLPLIASFSIGFLILVSALCVRVVLFSKRITGRFIALEMRN